MILRFYLVVGLILLGGTGYFIVAQTPPTVQAAPVVGDVSRLREEGLLPEGTMFENEEIEHDIFGVPPEDEAMIEAAMENMDMGSMDMGSNATMDMTEGDTMDMGEGGQMDMADGDGMDMAEGDEDHAEDSEAAEEEAARLMTNLSS